MEMLTSVLGTQGFKMVIFFMKFFVFSVLEIESFNFFKE